MANVTLTINPKPSNATVVITAQGAVQSGNSITVPIGTVVTYKISKSGYKTKENTFILDENRTVTIEILKNNQIDFNNVIQVLAGHSVTFLINHDDYLSVTGDLGVISGKMDVEVPLIKSDLGNVSEVLDGANVDNFEVKGRTAEATNLKDLEDDTRAALTIAATPTDATVTFTALSGNPVITGNTIEVDIGTVINWKVEREGYVTRSGSEPVILSRTKPLNLTRQMYILTVNTYPSDATLVLSYPNCVQTGNTIKVPYEASVKCTATATGHKSKTVYHTVYNNESIPLELDKETYLVTVTSIPNDADITLVQGVNIARGQGRAQISAQYKDIISWTISRIGYHTRTGPIEVLGTQTVPVNLTKVDYTYTITPEPEDALVTLTVAGQEPVSGIGPQSITAPYESILHWTVEKTNYYTRYGDEWITQDDGRTVRISETQYQVVITPEPLTAKVKIEAEGYDTVEGEGIQYMDVIPGTVVNWEVSKEGYVSQTGTETITRDLPLEVPLNPIKVTVKIKPDPNNAHVLITAPGYSNVEGLGEQFIIVNYGTIVSWVVSKEDYGTEYGSIPATESQEIPISLTQQLVTLTVYPDPEEALVVLTADGYTQVGNSIKVLKNVEVTCTVSCSGYKTETFPNMRIAEDTDLPVKLTWAPNPTKEWLVSSYPVPAGAEDSVLSVVAYGDKKWVGICPEEGYGVYTQDFQEWSAFVLPAKGPSDVLFYGGEDGKKKFILLPYNHDTILYSTDGITWESEKNYGTVTKFNGCVYDSILKMYVASSDSSPFVAYSSDGIHWKSGSLPTVQQGWGSISTNNQGTLVCYSKETVGSNSTIAYSEDGVNFVETPYSPQPIPYSAGLFADNKFVALNNVNSLGYFGIYGTTGNSWTSFNYTESLNQSWVQMVYGSGYFVVGSNDSDYMTSIDGINWVKAGISSNCIGTIGYGEGVFFTPSKTPGIVRYTDTM